MRKFDITKNETGFFQCKKVPSFSKVTRWLLPLVLWLMATAGSANAQAPSLSYGTPQTFKQGVAITPMAPTASGVAPFAYSSTPIVVPSPGISYPAGLAFDSNGNLFVGSGASGTVKELPAGGGAAVPYGPSCDRPAGVTTDAGNNVYVTDFYSNIYKIPPGGGPAITVAAPLFGAGDIALDRLGNIYVIDIGFGKFWKIPAGGGVAVLLTQYKPNGLGAIAIDDNNNIYLSDFNDESLIKIPAGGGSPVTLGTGFFDIAGLVTDPAGNLFACESGHNRMLMIPAGGGSPVTIASGFYPYRVTLDKYGSLFVSTGTGIDKINRTGGYFISPSLPPGLSFDENTGTISGTPVSASPATNYVITAYNSAGRTSATIGITIAPASHYAGLSQLKLSPGLLSPAFSPSTTSYTAAVVNGVRSVQITPVLASQDATVTVNGVSVADNTASAPIPLSAGANAISVVVTAPDKVTTRTYTIAVNRPGNSNDDLTSLTRSAGVLSPVFASTTTSYTSSVVYGVASMTVTPVAGDPDANIKVNGANVSSGTASPAIPLSVGSNTITIAITSSDGTATKTYTLAVTRAASDNANLSALAISAGQLSPGFSNGKSGYFATVAPTNSTVTVTPTTAAATSSVTVNGIAVASGTASGPIPLAVGSNTVKIVVTALDGVTTKTFILTVTRPLPVNAYLSALTLSAGSLSPAFASTTTAYTVSVINEVKWIVVTPRASDPGATITVNGAGVSSGTTSGQIPLSVGSNTISIAVTSSDHASTQTYTLSVTRKYSTNTVVTLALSAGQLASASDSTYAATIPYEDSVITITPTPFKIFTTVKINGATVASGTASAPITLAVGANTITIVVTAPDRVTTKTYTLTATRVGPVNFFLKSITVSSGTVIRAFEPTYSWHTVFVPNDESTVTITPVASYPNAVITLNETVVPSGSAFGPIPVHIGQNDVNIEIHIPGINAGMFYDLTIYRAYSSNANLGALGISTGTLTPAFSQDVLNYTVNLPDSITSITLTPVAADPTYQYIYVQGGYVLRGGSQSVTLRSAHDTIPIKVYAADYETTKTYYLVVNRPGSNNDNLSSLTVSRGTLTPAFTPGTTSYAVHVGNEVTAINITPTVSDPLAQIMFGGSTMQSGESLFAVLAVGTKAFDFVVTSPDSTATKTYTVTVTRAASGLNMPDKSLSVNQQPVSRPIEDDVIVVHQGVSPNGDGINDFFVIDGIQAYPDNKLSIMNRNGALVFETKGYDNASKVFDGHSSKNGQMQLPGTYFYSLEYTVKGVRKHKTGYLVLKY